MMAGCRAESVQRLVGERKLLQAGELQWPEAWIFAAVLRKPSTAPRRNASALRASPTGVELLQASG